jgi:hypothetical protein
MQPAAILANCVMVRLLPFWLDGDLAHTLEMFLGVSLPIGRHQEKMVEQTARSTRRCRPVHAIAIFARLVDNPS